MISALKMQNFDADTFAANTEAPEPAQRYTEAEVRELVRAANERGLRDGRAEGRTEGERQLLERMDQTNAAALDDIVKKLDVLMQDVLGHRATLEAQVLEFALSVCDAVFPELVRAMSPERASAQVRSALKMAIGSSHVSIRLHPDTRSALADELTGRLEYYRLTNACRVEGDPRLLPGEVRMEWDSGSLSYGFETVTARILEQLQETHANALKARDERGGHEQ